MGVLDFDFLLDFLLTFEQRGRHRRRIKCEACADWDCPATNGSDLARFVSAQRYVLVVALVAVQDAHLLMGQDLDSHPLELVGGEALEVAD